MNPAFSHPLARRAVFVLIPATMLVTLMVSTVWGEYGVLRRHELRSELAAANQDLAATERENQRLLHDLVRMEKDPVVLERMVAEELGWGQSDAVIVRFDDEATASD